MIRYYGFLATRVRSKLLPKVYELQDQPERKAIPIRFPALMKNSFGVDPLECILCKSRMVLTGIVPGKTLAELHLCHERLAPRESWCFGIAGLVCLKQTKPAYYSDLCDYLGLFPVKLMFFRIRENSLTASQKNPQKLYVERFSICVLKFLHIKVGRFAATFCSVPNRSLRPPPTNFV